MLLERRSDRGGQSLSDARQAAAAARTKLTAELSEVEIDEAVMGDTIDPVEAALARTAIRSHAGIER